MSHKIFKNFRGSCPAFLKKKFLFFIQRDRSLLFESELTFHLGYYFFVFSANSFSPI